MAKVEDALEIIKGMTLLELRDLNKAIEEEFGITAAAPMMMAAGAPPSETPEVGAAFYFLFFGTMASMAAAALTAWGFLRPIGAPWRRAGLSAIAGFATLIAAAAAVPVDATFGPMALLVPALLFAGLAAWSAQRVFAWYRALP